MASALTIIIADDHPLFRGALKQALTGMAGNPDIVEAGDFEGAEEAFIAALKENPADSEAKSALSRIALWRRLEGTDPATLIGAAVDGDLDSQLAAADAEFGSMDLAAAFGRLLTLVRAGGDLREPARTRLLEFFEMIGPHPEVNAARRALASALY